MKNWEEEFDYKFAYEQDGKMFWVSPNIDDVKAFIRETLTSELEGLKVDSVKTKGHKDKEIEQWLMYAVCVKFNNQIDQRIKALQEEDKWN